MDNLTKKTTLLLPPELHRRLAREARRHGISLGRFVREACEQALTQGGQPADRVSEAVLSPVRGRLGASEFEAQNLAEELALESGLPSAEAVVMALRAQLDRLRVRRNDETLLEDLMAISRRCAALPDLDTRSADEILGYDESGVPT